MIDLEELERLEKAATSGPWETRLGDEFGKTDMLIMAPENPEPNAIEVVVRNKNPFDYIDPEYKANFDLIVALRNAAPDLFQRIRELEARVAELEGHIDEHNKLVWKNMKWTLCRKDERPGYITDGFGCYWKKDCPDCGAPMQVIRPGDCRCSAECYSKGEEQKP